MSNSVKEVLFGPIFNDNPIGLQILGICSALAVTTQMSVALVMCNRADPGDGILKSVYIPDSESDSEQYSDHCADDHYCFSGDRCGPDPGRCSLRYQQAVDGFLLD